MPDPEGSIADTPKVTATPMTVAAIARTLIHRIDPMPNEPMRRYRIASMMMQQPP